VGDFAEFTWTTAYPMINRLEVTVGINPNFLSCDTQDFDVFINSIGVGDLSIVAGETSMDFAFDFPAVAGPTYTVRYETSRSVTEGCGAAGFDYESSIVTFVPAP
jgi:hypothetical protein